MLGIFEEMLFRNIILNTLIIDNTKGSYRMDILISSILFKLIHLMNLNVYPNLPIAIITQVIYDFMLGYFSITIYLNTKSIYSVIIH